MNPADELFAKGKEAADRGNFEYAVAMFLNVVLEHPDHKEARLALRACEEQLFKARGAGFSAKLGGFFKGIGPLMTMTFMAKKPEKVMAAGEKFLVHWPYCGFATLKLAEALRRMNHLGAAIQCLEYLTKRQPQLLPAHMKLAQYYEENEQYSEACKSFEVICRLRPKDDAARRKLKDLYSMAHVDKTRLSEGATSMETVRDREKADELLRSEQLTKSENQLDEEIGKLQTALQENPEDVKKLVELGDLYFQAEKFKLALQCYEKAHQLDPRPTFKIKIGDVHLRAFRKAERQVKEAAQNAPGDQALAEKLADIRRRRVAFEVKEFEWRCSEYPTDLRMADQLGDAYARRNGEGDLQKAILQYQKAAQDPRIRGRAARKLAACFAQTPATYDMALNQYQRARDATVSFDEQKHIDYEMGLLCEKMNRLDDALAAYKRVYEVDAGFRDVGDRVIRLSKTTA